MQKCCEEKKIIRNHFHSRVKYFAFFQRSVNFSMRATISLLFHIKSSSTPIEYVKQMLEFLLLFDVLIDLFHSVICNAPKLVRRINKKRNISHCNTSQHEQKNCYINQFHFQCTATKTHVNASLWYLIQQKKKK